MAFKDILANLAQGIGGAIEGYGTGQKFAMNEQEMAAQAERLKQTAQEIELRKAQNAREERASVLQRFNAALGAMDAASKNTGVLELLSSDPNVLGIFDQSPQLGQAVREKMAILKSEQEAESALTGALVSGDMKAFQEAVTRINNPKLVQTLFAKNKDLFAPHRLRANLATMLPHVTSGKINLTDPGVYHTPEFGQLISGLPHPDLAAETLKQLRDIYGANFSPDTLLRSRQKDNAIARIREFMAVQDKPTVDKLRAMITDPEIAKGMTTPELEQFLKLTFPKVLADIEEVFAQGRAAGTTRGDVLAYQDPAVRAALTAREAAKQDTPQGRALTAKLQAETNRLNLLIEDAKLSAKDDQSIQGLVRVANILRTLSAIKDAQSTGQYYPGYKPIMPDETMEEFLKLVDKELAAILEQGKQRREGRIAPSTGGGGLRSPLPGTGAPDAAALQRKLEEKYLQ